MGVLDRLRGDHHAIFGHQTPRNDHQHLVLRHTPTLPQGRRHARTESLGIHSVREIAHRPAIAGARTRRRQFLAGGEDMGTARDEMAQPLQAAPAKGEGFEKARGMVGKDDRQACGERRAQRPQAVHVNQVESLLRHPPF